MIITTLHETIFDYERPVTGSYTEARLCPVSDASQTCRQFSLSVDPLRPLTTGNDYYGNLMHTFNILAPHQCMVVTGHSVVETHRNPFAPQPTLPDFELKQAHHDYCRFDGPVEKVPELWELAHDAGLKNYGARQAQPMGTMRQEQGILSDAFAGVQLLNTIIHEKFEYAPESTDVDTKISHVFATGRGVCQDFAHIFIGVCRAVGLPARYVSGYLVTSHSRGAEGAVASHAWAEVLLPEVGWCAFDPTNNLLVNNYYIKVAVGRDYRDVAPTRGLYLGQEVPHMLRVRVHTVVEDEDVMEVRPELVG